MACTCTTVSIQIIVVLLTFTVFSFLPKLERSAEQLLAADFSYFGCIPANKPSIASCFSRTLTVLFTCLERSVKEVLMADLSAHVVGAGKLLIARSINYITGPTDTRTETGYKWL